MAKPGRNDPCHCGSGKKYKKCCQPKELAAEGEVIAKDQAARAEREAARRLEQKPTMTWSISSGAKPLRSSASTKWPMHMKSCRS